MRTPHARARAAALGLAATLLLALPLPADAYNLVHARNIALGGSYAATTRGVETVGVNPAFLAFRDNPSFSLTLPLLNAGFRFSNDFLNINAVNNHFVAGKVWDDAEKAQILSEIEGNEWDFNTNLMFPLFGVSFPSPYLELAFTLDGLANYNMKLSNEFVNIALNGYSLDDLGTRRDFGDTGADGYTLLRAGFTMAKAFHNFESDVISELTTGFTFNYLYGFAFFDVSKAEGSLLMDIGRFEGSGMIELVSASPVAVNGSGGNGSGSGVGLDFGLGAKVFQGRGVAGLSFLNLINRMEWTGAERRIFSYDLSAAPSISGIQQGDRWLEENLALVDSLVEDNASVSSKLPSTMLLTGGWYLQRSLLFTATWRQGLNNVPGGTTTPLLGMGIEYSGLGVFPVRTGVSFGGEGGFTLGGGFGLYFGPWRTDIGWAMERGVFNTAKGIYLGLNTTLMFGLPKRGAGRDEWIGKGKEKYRGRGKALRRKPPRRKKL